MKILLYSLNFSPESVGIGKYSGELAQWLSDHEVRVITAQPYFPVGKYDLNFQTTTVGRNTKIYQYKDARSGYRDNPVD